MDIKAAYREVGTYRGAAEICGTTHKTVKRVVLAEAERASVEPGSVRHNYDAVRDVVVERVAKTRGRISAKRLLPTAQAAGYSGSAPEFPAAGRRREGGVAVGSSSGAAAGGVGAGRHVGDRLG